MNIQTDISQVAALPPRGSMSLSGSSSLFNGVSVPPQTAEARSTMGVLHAPLPAVQGGAITNPVQVLAQFIQEILGSLITQAVQFLSSSQNVATTPGAISPGNSLLNGFSTPQIPRTAAHGAPRTPSAQPAGELSEYLSLIKEGIPVVKEAGPVVKDALLNAGQGLGGFVRDLGGGIGSGINGVLSGIVQGFSSFFR